MNCGPSANVSNSTKTSEGTLYKDTVFYTCLSGFEMSGDANVTCQANGSWTSPPPTCSSEFFCEIPV